MVINDKLRTGLKRYNKEHNSMIPIVRAVNFPFDMLQVEYFNEELLKIIWFKYDKYSNEYKKQFLFIPTFYFLLDEKKIKKDVKEQKRLKVLFSEIKNEIENLELKLVNIDSQRLFKENALLNLCPGNRKQIKLIEKLESKYRKLTRKLGKSEKRYKNIEMRINRLISN